MAEGKISYNTLLDDIECVVCKEPLCDPRALPCGHSYCGPPRTCLESMEIDDDFFLWRMKCAVCRADHSLQAKEVNPLYGIRDLFPKDEATDPKPNYFVDYIVHCTTHWKLFTLWCKTCSVKICDDCLDIDHDEHSVKKLKRHLVQQMELKLGGELTEKLQIRKNSLWDVSSEIRGFEKQFKQQMKALNGKFSRTQVAEKEILKELHAIEMYLDLDHFDSELETMLLLCLNDVISTGSAKDLSDIFVGQTSSVVCQTDSTKSVEKASQYVSEPNTFESGEITLHVEQRNPFKVATVTLNTDMWGFKFHISGTLEHCDEHKYSKECEEKMFLISITDNKPNGSFFDVVAIKYEVRLHNWVDSTNTISRAGSTIGGGNISIKSSDKLILHSELIDPCKNWMNQEDNLKFSIDLSVYKMG